VIVDPMGEVLAEGVDHAESIVVADVDPERVAEVRDIYRFLPDRRD